MAKCANCSKLLGKRNPGAQCNKCSKWYHGSCASLSNEQLCALSETDSVDWKCSNCASSSGNKKKRVSVILPDNEEDSDQDHESTPSNIQNKVLMEIRQELRQLRQSVKDIIRDELQSTLQYYSDKIDEYESKAKDHEMRVKIVENQVRDATNSYKNLAMKNEALEKKVAKIEQANYNNQLEICGVAENMNVDVLKVATSVCQLLKRSQDDIIGAYRKSKPISLGSQQAERARMDAPITVLLREGKRDGWCAAAKKTMITTQALGLEGEVRVYLREALTPTTSYLLWKSKKILKETAVCEFVWCTGGQVMAREKTGDKKIFYVNKESDIDRIRKELCKT